jgi:hypothetical protein
VNVVPTQFSAPVNEGPGPILIDHTTPTNHVVHGAYGMASILDAGWTHITATWCQAAPYEVVLHFTQPHDGRAVLWLIARDLLRSGGGDGDVRVTFGFDDPGTLCVSITGDDSTHHVAILLDARWVAELLGATDRIVAPAVEYDSVLDGLPAEWRQAGGAS